jgi:hypothetical protein
MSCGCGGGATTVPASGTVATSGTRPAGAGGCGCGGAVRPCSCSSGSVAGAAFEVPGTTGARARLSHRDGQLLAARDLRDEQARDDLLRQLHTRHLHGTWGVALGFVVHAAADARSVVVGPGYGVDQQGRDLLLPAALRVPVPRHQGGRFVLVAAAVDGSARGSSPCGHGGPDRWPCEPGDLRAERVRAALRWWRPEAATSAAGVPLVAVTVVQGILQGGLDLRPRRYARRLVRPRIASGTTQPERTDWQPWSDAEHGSLGLQVAVDATDGGFLSTPGYFVALRGPGGVAAVGTPVFVTGASATGFTARVADAPAPFGIGSDPDAAREAGWCVEWTGVEPWSAAEPVLDVLAAVAHGGMGGLFDALWWLEPLGGQT